MPKHTLLLFAAVFAAALALPETDLIVPEEDPANVRFSLELNPADPSEGQAGCGPDAPCKSVGVTHVSPKSHLCYICCVNAPFLPFARLQSPGCIARPSVTLWIPQVGPSTEFDDDASTKKVSAPHQSPQLPQL